MVNNIETIGELAQDTINKSTRENNRQFKIGHN